MLPPLTQVHLDPLLSLANKIADVMQKQPNESLAFAHPALHAVGNDFAGFAGQDRVMGQPDIGCAALEHKICSANGRAVGQRYAKLIAISRWNETFLNELGMAPVHLCYQGIDTGLFHPGPRNGLWQDRFIVFSGGKFEFRKAQDIVIAAFKAFHTKHPEALLVAAWQNLLPQDIAPFAMAGHIQDLPEATPLGLNFAPWLVKQGLQPGSFLSLPYTPNLLMPSVLRECDVALFPNRCEGGTNLVAMEAMACGVPTYVANNTGQKDLVDLLGCPSFDHQSAVKAPADMPSVEDWGETDVAEVIAALEEAYDQREAKRREALVVAEKLKAFDWALVNDKFLDTIFA